MKGDINMIKLKDNDIRDVLLNDLYKKYSHDTETKIVNEMGVLHGQSRVDVATINGIFHGYEIKSESDTLERLPTQIEDYNKVFDRVTLVVSSTHLEKAKILVPKWWGIIEVKKKLDTILFKNVRKGRINKNIDPSSLIQLLWKEEAKNLLIEKGLERGYLSKPKYVMYDRLVDSVELDILKSDISRTIRSRENWLNH